MKHSSRRALRAATLVVVLAGVLLVVAGAGAAAPARATTLPLLLEPLSIPIFQQAELTAPTGIAGDYYGRSVAVDGDTAVVGCPEASGPGSVYVYVRSGLAWTLQQHLVAPDGATWDSLGLSVAVSGDTIVAGAPSHATTGHTNLGAVYIWTRTAGVWSLQGEFLGATDGDSLGWAVAIDGDTVVAGAPYVTPGRVEVYARASGAWSLQKHLSGDAAEFLFGRAVAVDGDTVVVGAPGTDGFPSTIAGAVHVYKRAGTGWPQQGPTLLPDAATDEFGESVALDGDTLLVGAPNHVTTTGAGRGAAYVLTRSGNDWSRRTELAGGARQFAADVALQNGTAVLADGYADVGGVTEAGRAIVYTGSGASWTPQADLTAAAPVAHEGFGGALAISGATILVGVPSRAVGGVANRGAAVVEVLDTTPPVTTPSWTPAPTSYGWNRKAVSVTLSATDAESPVTSIKYRLAGASSWTTYSGPFSVSTVGVSNFECQATDSSGNVETPVAFSVKIDKKKPTTQGWNASVKHGKKVKLRFKVNDPSPSCGMATVTLKFYKGKRLKKTIAAGVVKVDKKTVYRWKCTLPKGRYTMKVLATDIAGNPQNKVGRAYLTVN